MSQPESSWLGFGSFRYTKECEEEEFVAKPLRKFFKNGIFMLIPYHRCGGLSSVVSKAYLNRYTFDRWKLVEVYLFGILLTMEPAALVADQE